MLHIRVFTCMQMLEVQLWAQDRDAAATEVPDAAVMLGSISEPFDNPSTSAQVAYMIKLLLSNTDGYAGDLVDHVSR